MIVSDSSKKLTLKYTNIQIFHVIVSAVVGGYATTFLLYKDFTTTEIGFAFAMASIISIIIQPPIAAFADKTKSISIRQINMFFMFIGLVAGIIMFLANNYKSVVLITYIIIRCIQITLGALINSLAMEYVNKGYQINYGLARGMASLAFAIFSTILGFLISRKNPDLLMPIFILLYIILMISTYYFRLDTMGEGQESYIIKDKSVSIDPRNKIKDKSEEIIEKNISSSGLIEFLKNNKLFTVFVIGFALVSYSEVTINTYLINIIDDVGGDSESLGTALAIAAICELPVMFSFSRLLTRIKCSSLIKISAFFYFLKALTTLLATNIFMVYFAQALQMFSFAIFIPASVYYVNAIIPKKDSVKGQTILSVAIQAIAGVLANVVGGRLQDLHGTSLMLLVGTLVTLVGMLIVFKSTQDTPLGAYKNTNRT